MLCWWWALHNTRSLGSCSWWEMLVLVGTGVLSQAVVWTVVVVTLWASWESAQRLALAVWFLAES